jgi:hypothetical protein
MGKSAEWKRQQAEPAPGVSAYLPLGDAGRGKHIRKALSKLSEVKHWLRHPGSDLWLWLDGYDEALLHEAKLAQALLRQLAEWPTAGLHLRILSRTATWPDFFTKELGKHFGSEQAVTVLQLAPLTSAQIRQAAEAHAIDADAFETAVMRAEAVALASRPVTLRLLLKLWLRGQFSIDTGRGVDLLEKGCRLLCAEGWDSTHRTYRQADPERRFRLAAQLALLMVGSGRRALTFDEADDGHQRLRLRDITDQPLLFPDRADPVPDYTTILNLLKHSGLFVATESEARWTHPVFADYLAAWALHQAQVPPAQLRNLLRAEVPEAGLVPALRDMGVWLAALSPAFAADLGQLDPLTAIRADVLTADDDQRTRLTTRLLALATTRHFYPYRAEAYLGRLAHPGLAAQLELVLHDPTTPPEASWLAHQMAVSCAVRPLVPFLLTQALATSLPVRPRVEALQSLRQLASPDECRALRPLLNAIPADDDDDEFRGALLPLLWPQQLTIDELLPLLTPQQNTSLAGNYSLFVDPSYSGGLRVGLTAAHLPRLLRWLVRQDPASRGANQWVTNSLRAAAQQVAWQHTADPTVLPWLALALRYWLRHHEASQLPAEAKLRQRVLTCWVSRHQLPRDWDLFQSYPAAYFHDEPQAPRHQSMVDKDDFDFILAQLRATQHPGTVDRLSAVALGLFHESFETQAHDFQAMFSALYAVVQEKRLAIGQAWLLPLDTSQYQFIKEEHFKRKHQTQRRRRQRRRVALFTRRWKSRTQCLLTLFTRPDRPNPLHSWFRAWQLLTRNDKGKYDHFQLELTQGYVWPRLTPTMRTQLAALAWRVVQEAPALLYPGQHYNSLDKEQAAALAALLLCQQERPQDVDTLSAAAWRPWLSTLLYGVVAEVRRAQLFGIARLHHRRAVLQLLTETQDFWAQLATSPHGYARLNELLREVPDQVLWWRVLRAVKRGHWSHSFNQEILAQLLKLGFYPAERFRKVLLTQSPTALHWHILTFSAFRTALSTTNANSASAWWRAWQQLRALGPENASYLLQRLSDRPLWTNAFPPTLADEQLADLLHWTVRELGIKEESKSDDWEPGAGRGRLRTFRHLVIKVLTERATPKAWHTLRELADELDYPRWLTYYLDEAHETYCRRVWQPPAPGQLLEFLRHATRRWPHGDADVLDLILESLGRLQARLQGEPARAQDLWQQVGTRTGSRIVRGNKVVSENRVTDYVQSFLNDDLERQLFSTQREVQLRAPVAGQRGQELDLYVQAVPLDEYGRRRSGERLLVFIEAKHHDNTEVSTALQAQLVNRYLRQHEARTGLFLVYWHKPGATAELEALRQQLAQQAVQASSAGLLLKSYVLDIRLPDDQ